MPRPSKPSKPLGASSQPLGDPRAFRGYSTKLKKLAEPQPRSEFLPDFASSVGSFTVELIKIIAIALAIIIPIRYFILQPFYVRGASMEPNFHDNEYLIIDELSYRLHEPRRGDVVVLRNPHQTTEFFIKRIIGLPGETVTIREGNVYITNAEQPAGKQLDEDSYLPPDRATFGNVEVTLGTDEYFVMGDNRPASLDSRSFGPIDRKEIIGRTALRAWPLTKAGTFRTPETRYETP